MISGVNAKEFNQELERDFADLEQDVTAAENDIALQVLEDCRDATPFRTGKLQGEWGIAIGAPDPTAPGGGEEALAGRLPQQPVFVQNNDFRASFFEHGTVKMAPRPMAAPAIERANRKVVRL